MILICIYQQRNIDASFYAILELQMEPEPCRPALVAQCGYGKIYRCADCDSYHICVDAMTLTVSEDVVRDIGLMLTQAIEQSNGPSPTLHLVENNAGPVDL